MDNSYNLPVLRSLTHRLLTVALLLTPVSALAAPTTITYTDRHHIVSVNVASHPEWQQQIRTWYFRGVAALPPARLKTCGREPLSPGEWTFQDSRGWSTDAIERTLQQEISPKLNRPAGSVAINRSASGTVSFDGRGLTGRSVDVALAADLTRRALEEDVDIVVLPVRETQPTIDVRDPELRSLGIREVVTIGESVFAKSPVNRRHNIAVGLARFNGHLIPHGSVFSFDETLGPVNASTGYRKELVIQGDTTLPDYGGGLCQVGTTAYRGPWEYGMPILQRRNHSYAVSYYSPQGTDATVYPPNVDMKFRNDTPGALLIQTFTDDEDRAFFVYYGTRDDRRTEVFGPYITDRVAAPTAERTLSTTELAPGERRKAGERHDGMKAMWYRTVQSAGSGTTLEKYFSAYQARPLTWQVGAASHQTEEKKPDWFPDSAATSAPSSAATDGAHG